MHETTRRSTCRAGFLLGCIAPTLGTLAWIVYLATPFYQAAERTEWQRRLGDAIGAQVTLQAVQHPEPSLVRLERVTIRDPETGVVLADAPSIELTRQSDGWIAYVPQARTPRGQLRQFAARVQAAQWRKSSADLAEWQLLLGELQVTDRDSPVTLLDLQVRASHPGAASADRLIRHEIEFRLPGLDMAQPVRLVVTRRRDSSQPYSEWQLSTGPQAIPAATLAIVRPEFVVLGENAQVTGTIRLSERDGRWTGEAEGRLAQVDLDGLVTGRFPHKLTGTAEVVLSRLAWEDGRLVSSAGTLTVARGIVSRSLLVAAASDEGLRLELSPRVAESDDSLLRFHELAFGFELTVEGLQIAGQCAGEQAGVLITDAQGPLLSEATQPLVPAVAIVRVLAPQNEIQVPASLQTETLLRWLPLPPLAPVAPAVARPTYVPIRLR